MRVHGIHYDVGTPTIEGSSTRPTLTVEEIERDIADITRGLCASAIRITGNDVGRLASAGEAKTVVRQLFISPFAIRSHPIAAKSTIRTQR